MTDVTIVHTAFRDRMRKAELEANPQPVDERPVYFSGPGTNSIGPGYQLETPFGLTEARAAAAQTQTQTQAPTAPVVAAKAEIKPTQKDWKIAKVALGIAAAGAIALAYADKVGTKAPSRANPAAAQMSDTKLTP